LPIIINEYEFVYNTDNYDNIFDLYVVCNNLNVDIVYKSISATRMQKLLETNRIQNNSLVVVKGSAMICVTSTFIQ